MLQCAVNGASEYCNWNNTSSVVLFALVADNYNFMFVDAEYQGRICDSGVLTNIKLYEN